MKHMSALTNEKKVLVLAITLMDLLVYLSMFSIPPLIGDIIKQFSVNYTTVSSLMYLMFLPQIIFSIYASKLIAKYNAVKVTLFGASLLTIGNLTVALGANINFLLLQVGRLIVGIGVSFAFIATLSLVSTYFRPEEQGKPMGMVTLTYALAIITAFNGLGGIALLTDYVVSLWVMFGFSVTATAIFYWLSSMFPEAYTVAKEFTLLDGLKNSQMLLVTILWLFFNMGVGAYLTWIKIYLIYVKSVALTIADLLSSLFMIFGFFRPLAGALSDRVNRRKIFITWSTLGFTVGVTLLYFFDGIFLVLDIIIIGISALFIAPTIFTLPGEIMKEDADIGYGMLNTGANIGYVIGPFVTGVIFDTFGLVDGFFAIALFYFLTFIVSLFIKVR